MAAACSAGEGPASPSSTTATSARRRAASARHAAPAAPRSGSRAGAGHNSPTAMNEAADARPQPASRSGIDDAGPANDTGRMNASSSATVAPASTELTTPAKSTPNPTIAIASAAVQAEREASVPMQTNAAPVAASAVCACSRERIGPPKSTSSSIANAPIAAKIDTVGLPITWEPSANSAGITSAARPARRSADSPGSCARSQCSGSVRQLVIRQRSPRPEVTASLRRWRRVPGPSRRSCRRAVRPTVRRRERWRAGRRRRECRPSRG